MRARLPAIGLVAGMAAAIFIPASAQDASAQTAIMLQQHDAINDLAPTRERNGVEVLRMRKNYGPGAEQFSFDCAVPDPALPTPDRIKCIAVGMKSGELASGDVVLRETWQGAVMPFEIVKDDTAVHGVRLEANPQLNRYITQRAADEARAFNQPQVMWIKGDYFAVKANWDREGNNNTEQYTTILHSDGSVVNVTGERVRSNGEEGLGQSVLTYAKNNDNVCGYQFTDALERNVMADGRVRIVFHCLGNGNGRDDSWWAETYIDCDEATDTCDIQRGNDVAICLEEERSRGTCESVNGVDVCFCTNGNSQPMREGVWAGAVDPSTGDLLWRERLAYRGEDAEGRRTYAMRIACQAETTVEGEDTGNVLCAYHMKRGNNRNGGRKGGRSEQLMLMKLRPDASGPNVVSTSDITSLASRAGADLTHMATFFSFEGTVGAERPVLQFLSGEFQSGRLGSQSDIVNIAVDGPTPELLQTRKLTIPGDTHLYANYLGNNPGNQGRNYMDMRRVNNIWRDQPGAAQGIPFFQLTVLAGKTTDDPKLKLDVNAEIWAPVVPAAAQQPTDETPQNDPTEPGDSDETPTGSDDPGTPSTDEPDTSSPSQTGSLGGCSAAGTGANGGFLLLIGLGLVLGLRRRRN